jgi:hypothetical protein
MIIEMNPEDDEVFGDRLDNNNSNSDSIDEDVLEPSPEPHVGPGGESDAEPEAERDAEARFDPDLEYLPRGAELRDVLSSISTMANELESLSYLSDPKNDYARYRRIELQSRLSTELDKLRRYRVKLDKEVLRCQRNLDRIRADAARLNLPKPRECYSEAEYEQEKQLDEAVHDRDAVVWAIAKVQAALSSSRIRGFPTRDPFPPDVPIYFPSPRPKNHPSGLGSEVNELLSLGPLGKDHGQR